MVKLELAVMLWNHFSFAGHHPLYNCALALACISRGLYSTVLFRAFFSFIFSSRFYGGDSDGGGRPPPPAPRKPAPEINGNVSCAIDTHWNIIGRTLCCTQQTSWYNFKLDRMRKRPPRQPLIFSIWAPPARMFSACCRTNDKKLLPFPTITGMVKFLQKILDPDPYPDYYQYLIHWSLDYVPAVIP